MLTYIPIIICGIIITTEYRLIASDDVNEDLCGRIDLDGPVQAIQYKLESLYSGSEKETDSNVAEIKSNFDDLSKKAEKISDDCDGKTPKLLGFINQMNQAKLCIDSLSKRNEIEAQTECQSVHDEAKLNFVVRSIANNSEGYEEILKCAHTFTDLVQRVKIYRAILREWDKGDEKTNVKFYDTVKNLINEKNAPSNALRDILKNIALRSVLNKKLKFTNLTLVNDLYDYDYTLANAAIEELVTKVYDQNNYTAKHLLFLPSIQSRVAAFIAFYNKSNNHNQDLNKKLFQIIYITRLHPDFGKVDTKSKLLVSEIIKKLTNDITHLKGFGEVCFDTMETEFNNTNENTTEKIFVKAVSKTENVDDWEFNFDPNGSILQISLSDEPSTMIFMNKNEYPAFDEMTSLFQANNVPGNWKKLTTDEICSKMEYRDFICFDGNKFLSPDAFDNAKIRERKLIYDARKKDRQTMCPKL